MTITQINNRYMLETSVGKMHILNMKSLKWNLKHVFGFSDVFILDVVSVLDECGVCPIKLGA